MSSDFLLIYGETWQSIHNALKRQEMNLQEAAVCYGSDWQLFLVGVGSQNPSQGWAASLLRCRDPGPSRPAVMLRLEQARGSGS